MKKGLILLVSFIFVFLILSIGFASSEENQTPTLQQPAPVQTTIRCSSDTDCGSSSFSKFCKDSQACASQNANYCQNPGTAESFCTNKAGEACYPCQYGCQNGECVPQPSSTYCTDPDGINHFTAGKTCTNTQCELDKCEGNTIIEYTCKDNRIAVDHTYGCIKGCSEGACLPETTPSTVTQTAPCVQRGNSCCKADVCETPTVCEQGFITTFKGCDSNCKSIVSCQSSAQEQIKEQVKCVFANSKTQQKCYLAEYNDKFFCSGIETCVMDVNGYRNQQLTWKSTCGGYTYTTIDGLNDYAKFDCSSKPTEIPTSETIPPQSITPYATTWYSIAYWECYDKTNEKQGGGTSCKPSEVWKKYADEFCNNHCDKETGKCGVNSFGVHSECSGATIIEQPVCGNGICESGEGEICEVQERVYCKEGEPCKASTAKCYTACANDCKQVKEKEISAKLNEKFNLGMSQSVVFDYQSLKINFNDLFIPPCQAEQKEETATATIEKYESITGKVISGFATETEQTTQTETACLETEPYAVLQLKYINKEGKAKTDVIKIRVGEKKQVFDFAISFLDYERSSKQGVFFVSLASTDTFSCPENCVCNIYGSVKECKKIEKCGEEKMLCQDGVCREKCEITNITTECKFGCFYNDRCLPYGLRVNGLYCSINNDMKTQLLEENCDNNFECNSNVCVSGKCVSSSLIEKIISWFKNLFGG